MLTDGNNTRGIDVGIMAKEGLELLTHGLGHWLIFACCDASVRTEVLEPLTHNAKGEVIDAHTSWEWSKLCNESMKLDLSLRGLS